MATPLVRSDSAAPAAVSPVAERRGLRKTGAGPREARPRDRWLRPWGRPIDAKGLAAFTRQLATLVRAGLPLLRSLEVLARQERRARAREVIEELAEMIRTGGSLSDGLAAQARTFDRLYLNMVRAGEAGGVLDVVLERLALFMEKAQRTRGRIRTAMVYPVIIVGVATTIVAVLMVAVVPKFEDIFAGLLKGQPLPALTQGLLSVSQLVMNHSWLLLALPPAGFALMRLLGATRRGERWRDTLLIRLPVLGEVALKAAVARFARTLGTLVAAGVPILQALVITRDTCGNVPVADALDVVHRRVKEGDSVTRPLEAARLFPGMVTSMVAVGEETGALPAMLTRIADIYDEEVDNAVTGLTTLIEPLMIVLMALVVGTIVIALFLPLVGIIEHLS